MVSRAKFLCVDCDKDTGKSGEFYFIHTELWLSVMPTINGMLCLDCLESRLGRMLNPSDFPNNHINRNAKNLKLRGRIHGQG